MCSVPLSHTFGRILCNNRYESLNAFKQHLHVFQYGWHNNSEFQLVP
jgi:hypothetical protein